MVKYQDAVPIRTRQHSVWIIVADGERRIAIWAKEATIEDVHAMAKRDFDEFRVAQLGVGTYELGEALHSYMDDARWVDQDWNVKLRFS